MGPMLPCSGENAFSTRTGALKRGHARTQILLVCNHQQRHGELSSVVVLTCRHTCLAETRRIAGAARVNG
jgi:hypothetical protein